MNIQFFGTKRFCVDNPGIQKESEIMIGEKYGCLLVQDDGLEYQRVMDERIRDIEAEKAEFVQKINEGELKSSGLHDWIDGQMTPAPSYIYRPTSFKSVIDYVRTSDFDEVISRLKSEKRKKHYKCQCKKCGKIRYYSAETLLALPNVCCKPMYCSAKYTYSISAQNATYRKKQKYRFNESIHLVDSRDEVIPKDIYCDSWNEKRRKELIKQAEKDALIIASIPRVYAKNYNENYVGKKYESYEVLECLNEALESTPVSYFNQRHQKKYRDIVVYKEYRCRCYLCGKERKITCDKFGISPPTDYGYTAYNGYWSQVYCDCHWISSFQWIVNDILIKHNIDYEVEVEVDGLRGIDNETPLRFDFAVNHGGKIFAFIECQGEQHFKPIEEFGGERRFSIQQRNDEEKRKYAKEKKIKLIEIPYKQKKYEQVEEILKEQNIIL